MNRLLHLVFVAGLVALLDAKPQAHPLSAKTLNARDPTFDVLDYVDPLIGTTNGGHVFPGATLPYSLAKAVADGTGETQAGFSSDNSSIVAWSGMHDDGTGGGSSLGNFALFPISSCAGDVSQCAFARKERGLLRVQGSAKARPGYFSLNLTNGVQGETTVTNKTALYRFTFSPESQKPLVLIGLEDLGDSYRDGGISVNPQTGRIIGNGTFTPSFGNGAYKAYFCADFKGATISEAHVYSLNEGKPIVNTGELAGAFVRFNKNGSTPITVRVGYSFISSAQACSTAEKEIPDFDFHKAREQAETAWRSLLNTVAIKSGGANRALQTTFWSGLYRAFISPQDYTGENPLWKSAEPYFDSFYCIWDSFRAQHPLLTIVDPATQTRMVRTLIDVYRNLGKLPDCRMSLDKGFTQGGSNADIVLADAYVKGLKIGIDWDVGYEAVVSDAEVEPPNWDLEGRGGLESWKTLHYIPKNDRSSRNFGTNTRSISRTVEYAYDDFCVALIAKGLGKTQDAKKYFERSGYWKNLYKADQKSAINGKDTGFVGFLQPKEYSNQSWAYQDPILCSPLLDPDGCYLNPQGHETYEGSCWLYTFFAPGDMAALITTLGGAEQFTKRLDFFHESGLLYIGDEQAFLTVFLYHYSGRPALSAKRAHAYIPKLFNTSVSGIPGNDDSGAMGSFSSLTMLGVWPNAGQDVYLIIPPFFEEVSVTYPLTGKKATIRNINFDAGYKNVYIQSAKLDGKPYTKNWLDHSFFREGKTLELTLGSTESSWGQAKEDLPPSLSTGGIL